MQFQKIINSKLDNLDEFISRNKKNYESASPFPFIVIEDFFSVEFLNEILKQFPNLEEKKKQQIILIKMKLSLLITNMKDFQKILKLCSIF